MTGLDRLLRILTACRPKAVPSVPDCTLSAKNLPPATFIYAETREQCEIKLAEMIERVKAESALEKAKLKEGDS